MNFIAITFNKQGNVLNGTLDALLHLMLTGRDANPQVIEKADLVTEMKEIKHPYKQGIQVQPGLG